MFSSINNVNPLLPSSSQYHSPSSFFFHTTDDIFTHHHLHDPLVGHSSPANAPVTDTVINMMVSNGTNTMAKHYDIDRPNGEYYCYGTTPSNFVPSKRPVKKDRHSKIFTAQGLRDRRVRLSMETARKFFDLQEMLGFDKPSKTLGWLLTKSTRAIMELTQTNHSFSNSTSECEVISCGIDEAADNGDQEPMISKEKSLMGLSKKKRKLKQSTDPNASSLLVAKEVRAKARARARERTREKLRNKMYNESKKFPDLSPLMLNQLIRSSSQLETTGEFCMSCLKANSEVEEPSFDSLANLVERKNLSEESATIKRKLKAASIFSYQQNLVISKDVSSNNNYLPSLPQYWGAMTNMNLSTELETHGETWKAHNNQSLHWSGV